MKILIIEDNEQAVETLKSKMSECCVLDIANTGKKGEFFANTNVYDLILLDIGLPDKDGISVCRDIRQAKIKTPILMLTGEGEVDNKVAALDAGADDYLVKPFDFSELLARSRALMRRNPETLLSNILTVGDLSLDIVKNVAKYRQEVIPLRRKEFSLLEYLIRNKGRVLTRSMILEHVWDSDTNSMTNTVDVHVSALREKIDKYFKFDLITTIHGMGYKIES